MARVDYGSNPRTDEWTDFAACPKTPMVLGTTRAGYLFAWNLATISGPSKGADPPTLDPQYKNRIDRTNGNPQALKGVACSASGLVATIGDGSENYGELQVRSISGELKSDLGPYEKTPHAGLGKRVAWDASERYLITAAPSEYIVWEWNGRGLQTLARLTLSEELPLPSGRPVVGAERGQFIVLSGAGAWLYDAPSRSFVRAFGDSPIPAIADVTTYHRRHAEPAQTYTAFFENALRVVTEPEQVKTLSHPLFKVLGSHQIDLTDRKMNSVATFSCDVGSRYTDLIDERADCVRNLQAKWAEFLKTKHLRLEFSHDYTVPGWVRVLMTVRRNGAPQFRYIFESETNESETMGYSQITILKNSPKAP